MVEHELTPLQSRLLDMLKWFDDFCKKNNLQYFSVGGTLLGSVRHQGFIPWDDDIDIAMPRRDYNRLAELMGEKVFDHYVLETQNSSKKDFCYPYYKLYDTNTTLIEHYRKPLVRGIFLDIFPLDGVGADKEEGIKWYRRINHKYSFYLTRVAAIRRSRSRYKNLAIKVSQLIPECIIDNMKIRKELDGMCQKFSFTDSLWGGNLLGNWGEREIVPLKVFGTPTPYQFEDMLLCGPEDFDGYLSCIYGDWRKLPPKEKQVSHHDFLKLDLDNGYIAYKGE